MGLVKRQTSNQGAYTVNYGGFDSPQKPPYNASTRSERSYYGDFEGSSQYVDTPLPHTFPQTNSLKMLSSRKSPYLRYLFILMQYLVFGFVLMRTWEASTDLSKTNAELSIMNQEYSVIQEMLKDTENELKQAHNDFLKLQARVNTAAPHAATYIGVENSEGRKVLTDTILDRHNAQASRIQAMQETIQQIHKQDLIQKYGHGPYEIEVTVIVGGQRKYFTIETAPIDLMPHSIHTFMESVSNQVWDNTLFIHKVEHVVLATPMDEHGTTKSPELTKKLLFPEYSDKFPHIEHTIGYQGRPGGPEIYINLDDNSEHHGPGGQRHHDLVEEADPCFGKITHGIDVLTEFINLNAKAVQNDSISHTKIESMRIVKM